jgi:hypothetical protein
MSARGHFAVQFRTLEPHNGVGKGDKHLQRSEGERHWQSRRKSNVQQQQTSDFDGKFPESAVAI